MSKEILKNIATVSTGYSFREAITENLLGDSFILQAKDVDPASSITERTTLMKAQLNGKGEGSVLQKNDVILTNRASRSGAFSAAVFQGSERRVVASLSVFIIRLTDESITAEYLAAYFNNALGQNALRAITTGSMVQSLPIGAFRDLDIPIPDLSVQVAITGLNDIAEQQQKLLMKKISTIQKIKETAITQSIQS
jgi:restriction endonuclease S subunit